MTAPATAPSGVHDRTGREQGHADAAAGQREQQHACGRDYRDDQEAAGGAQPDADPGRDQRAEDAANAQGGDQDAGQASAEADRADQEDHQDRVHDALGEVAGTHVAGDDAQVGVAGDEADAFGHVGAEGGLRARLGRGLGPLDPGQGGCRDEEAERVGEHAGHGAEHLRGETA
jgi:hypothetical protein